MAEFVSPTSSYIITSLLSAYGKSDRPPATRRAITRDILADLIQSIEQKEVGYNKKLYVALLCLMYHGLLRCSEVTHSSRCSHNLEASQIELGNGSLIQIKFVSYKHNKPNPAPLCIKATYDSICPVRAIKRYTKMKPINAPALFSHENGRPVSRGQLVDIIKFHLDTCGRNSADFNTHSLRMGKATDMHRDGFTDRQIAVAGRWSSSAFLKYIKPNIIVI